MAVSIVQIGSGAFGSGVAGIGGFPATPTKGNRLIAVCACPRPSASVSGPSGWTLLGAGQDNIASNGCCIIFGKISAGTETTFTVSWSGGTGNWSILSYEVAGLTEVNPGNITDRSVTAVGSAVTTLTLTLSAATQWPDSIAIAAVAAINSMGALVSGPTGGFTDDTTGGADTGNFLWSSSKILSATETSSSTITWTTSRNAAGILRNFRGASLDGPWPVITPA